MASTIPDPQLRDTRTETGEAARRRSEARYRALSEATGLEVWRVDPSGAGAEWLDFVRADQREEVERAWALALATKQPFESEHHTMGPEENLVLVRAQPVIDDGEVIEWLGVCSDVTDARLVQRMAERLAQLQELSAALAGAVGFDEVAQLVVGEGRKALGAERSFLYVVDEARGRVRLQAMDTDDPEVVQRYAEVALTDDFPVSDAVRTGTLLTIGDEESWSSRYPEVESVSKALAVVPLALDGQAFGAGVFGWDDPKQFTDDESDFIETLGAQVAQALERARLYEAERLAARTLQRSLLPPRPPAIPGVQVATRYLPGERTVAVGGDFFDVFRLADNVWGLLIGDVCGKGSEAAALTALARYTLRAAAVHQVEPSAVLAELNTAVLAEPEAEGKFCAAVYARLELDRCGMWVTLSCGGHPRPIVVRRAGWVDVRGQAGMLVGVFEDARFSDDRVGLGPGDAIVLCTDGITEARNGAGEMYGEEALPETLLRHCEDDAETLAQAIVDGAQAFRADAAGVDDDIAVLVVRVPATAAEDPDAWLREALGITDPSSIVPGYPVPDGGREGRPPPPREARIRLEPEADAIVRARRFLNGVLHSWRMSALADGDAELLLSELATNAYRHAGSAYTVIVRYDGEHVRVEVGDGSRALPTPRQATLEDQSGRGLFLVDQLATRWGSTPTVSGKRVWFEMSVPDA